MFAEKGEIFYRFLTVEDKDDVINLLANNFCIEEPICKCLNFSEKERYEYATYASMFLADNRSMGAFDVNNSEKLCGVMINSASDFDPGINMEDYLQSVSKNTQYSIRVDNFLHKRIKELTKDGHFFACNWLSMDAAYFGKGIAKNLTLRTNEWLKNSRQFDMWVGVSVAPNAKHIGEKDGLKSVLEINMSEYQDEKTGERIFANAQIPLLHILIKAVKSTKSNL